MASAQSRSSVEGAAERRRDHRRRAGQHLAAGAVEGDERALAKGAPVGRGERARLGVEAELARADDAGQPEATCDHRGVARHAAADRQDAAGGVHAADVFRARLDADKDRRLVLGGGGLRRLGSEDDAAGGGAGAGGHPGAEDVACRRGVDLRVQVLDQASRLDAEQRLGTADRAGVGEVDGDADRGAGVAADRQRVEDRDLAVVDHEVEPDRVAEAGGGGGSRFGQSGEGARANLLERRRVGAGGGTLGPRERTEVAAAGRRGSLGIRPEAAGQGRFAGALGDELQRARAVDSGADGDRQRLHDEADAGVGRGALGLAQDARRGRGPAAGHRPGGGLELLGGVLRPGAAGLRREVLADRGEERAERRLLEARGGAEVAAHQRLYLLGVEAVDSDAEARDAADVEAQRRGGADLRDHPLERDVAGAEVEHGARAAPGAVLGAAAQREEPVSGEAGRQVGHRTAGGQRGDAVEGEGDPRRHRQAERGEPREIGRPAAVDLGAHRLAGIEADDRAGRRRDDLLRFHCSAA